MDEQILSELRAIRALLERQPGQCQTAAAAGDRAKVDAWLESQGCVKAPVAAQEA